MPNLTFNWLAIVTAIVAAFIFGWIWYGPLFSKPWAKALGIKMDKKPKMSAMYKSMGLQLLGTFLITYVIAHSVQVWRPSVWGVGADGSDFSYGLMCGFFTWIGFFVPLQLNRCTWEMKPWKLFFINAGHDFIQLQIICQILSHWR